MTTIINNPDNVDLESVNNKLQLKDRSNYKFIKSNFDFTSIDSSYQGDILEIRNVHDLQGGTVNLPLGVKLFFNGGKIENGTINGNNTAIEAGRERIFNTNIFFNGTFIIDSVYPEWFGARNGVDDRQEIQKAIDLCALIKKSTTITTVDIVLSKVSLASGQYNITSEIDLKSGVILKGSGMHNTIIQHSGSGNAIKAGAPNDTLFYTGTKVEDLTIIGDGVNSNYGFYGYHLIRLCHIKNVLIDGFEDNFHLERCWTFEILQCQGQNARRDNINWDGATNGKIQGGRFDLAGRHALYVHYDTDPASITTMQTENLTICEGAFQASQQGGIVMKNIKNANIVNNFIEALCQDGNTDYAYLHIEGDNKSNFHITGNYINKGSSGLDGKAAFYINNVKNFSFIGNATQSQTNGVWIGSDVESGCSANNAHGNTNVITNDSSGFIHFSYPSRPTVFTGKDLTGANNGLSQSPLVVGKQGAGYLAIGTISGVPMLQSFGSGTSHRLRLNPHAGKVEISSLDLSGIPTNPDGLQSGEVWRDGDDLKIK
ncbi:hypothetical protein U6A24_09755 [Aquimarina gracilis]|uniref:Parallel beta helix pectate lyase-like protein n=1 Tax=Aquimarina gracilis TaxID=874422 RepID=A0ABU5ZUI6_9FLAO|nr:hypothetical protein [Aquimarina gracilis]MEB3345746.1 hypothetical protein [Aquimarina gracilis]